MTVDSSPFTIATIYWSCAHVGSYSLVPGDWSHPSSLVLDLVVLEQVLPEGYLGGELGRAEVAADGVLGVRVQQPHVVLQARDVGVVLYG